MPEHETHVVDCSCEDQASPYINTPAHHQRMKLNPFITYQLLDQQGEYVAEDEESDNINIVLLGRHERI